MSNLILIYSGVSFFSFVVFLVKTKSRGGLPQNLSFNFIGINLSMLSLSVMADCTRTAFVVPADCGWSASSVIYVVASSFFFLLFVFFIRITGAGGLLRSSNFLYSLFFFFYFGLFINFTGSLVDAIVALELLNIFVLLFLVATFSFGLRTRFSIFLASSSLVKYGSLTRLPNALLGLFFLSFLVGIFFFFFFLNFTTVTLGVTRTSELAVMLQFFQFESYYLIFFFFVLLKLAGAPVHFWKMELFSSAKYVYLFFFSTLYLFIFLFIVVGLFKNFFFFFYNSTFVNFIVFFNFLFLMFNFSTILDLRHFLVVSTLLNSSVFILSISLTASLGLHTFFFLYFNYAVSSTLVFIFIILSQGDASFVSSLRRKDNNTLNFVYFLIPLLSMSGVAPSVGFFSKFYFLVGVWSCDSLLLFSMLSFLIVFSVVFYFQVFKNFFFVEFRGQARLKSEFTDGVFSGGVSLVLTFLGVSLLLLGFFFFLFVFLVSSISAKVLFS